MMPNHEYTAAIYKEACLELVERIIAEVDDATHGIDEELRLTFIAGALTRTAAYYDDAKFSATGVSGDMLKVLVWAKGEN